MLLLLLDDRRLGGARGMRLEPRRVLFQFLRILQQPLAFGSLTHAVRKPTRSGGEFARRGSLCAGIGRFSHDY